MTVEKLAKDKGFGVICLAAPEREIGGVYCGDLLSWVMGKAKSDDLWITIMSNVNIVAVASLSSVSAILLAEGVTVDGEVISAAEKNGINILSTDKPIYETAIEVSQII